MMTAIELGLIYAVMALGVYLTFRILDFADLTVDGSFTTGASIAALSIVNGVPPALATSLALVGGMAAGLVTGLLHTKGRINGLLAGILTQIALYSVNLRIMGKANMPLLREETLISPLKHLGWVGEWQSVGIFMVVAAVILLLIIWFLHTDLGLAMRATGDNPDMIRSFGVNTDNQKMLGLALSNGLVALCGAIIAQYQGFADIGMGIGLIVAGLASVIIGQAIMGRSSVPIAATAVVLGSVLYRVVIFLALKAGLNPNDMKLISAVLVVLALVLPQWHPFARLARGLDWLARETGLYHLLQSEGFARFARRTGLARLARWKGFDRLRAVIRTRVAALTDTGLVEKEG